MIKSKINNRIQVNNINIIKRKGKIQEKNPHKIEAQEYQPTQ
jgi:hypothetical protein